MGHELKLPFGHILPGLRSVLDVRHGAMVEVGMYSLRIDAKRSGPSNIPGGGWLLQLVSEADWMRELRSDAPTTRA